MQTIYLARHATPDWTRTDIPYFTPPGPPLNAQGELEAAALGAFLRSAGIGAIASSPLERCQRTAAIVGNVLGLPFQIDEALAEWQPREQAALVGARMQRAFYGAWEDMANNGHQAVLLLTHGGPIMELLRQLGMDAQVVEQLRIYDHQNVAPPAGLWQVNRSPDAATWHMHLAFMPQVA